MKNRIYKETKLISILMALSIGAASSTQANLIFNPGFELPGSVATDSGSNLTSVTIPGWVLFGAGGTGGGTAQVTPSTATFGYGDNFGRVVGNASITTSAAYRPLVTPGQELAYSFKLYTANPFLRSENLVLLNWFNSSGVNFSSSNILPFADGVEPFEEGQISGTVLVPDGAVAVGFRAFASWSPYRDVYFDDFSLAVVPEPAAVGALLGLAALATVTLRRRRRG